jgi:fibro-slime domain-containing protein
MRAFGSVCVCSIAFGTVALALLGSACNPGSNGTVGDPGGSAGGGTGGTSVTITVVNAGGASSTSNGTGGSTTAPAEVWPPPGYINVTNATYGAYALGPLLAGQGGGSGSAGTGGSTSTPGICSGLFGVVRDFRMSTSTPPGHPDFQHARQGDDKGIVTANLGTDGKPVYARATGGTTTTTGKTEFDQWYNDVPDVNMTYLLGLHFVQNGSVVTFAATIKNTGVPNVSYFPLDGQGFPGDEALGNDGKKHNFSFTTEIHTSFTYNGGETFTFQGDDDVFVFINGQLAIDLGGIHNQETQTVNLDQQATALGIAVGQVYSLAVFGAERHTTESNFRIDTTMVFTDCGQIAGMPYIP